MNGIQKLYLILVGVLLLTVGAWATLAYQKSEAIAQSVALKRHLQETQVWGDKVYEHQAKVQYLQEKTGSGKLDPETITQFIRNNGMKDPVTSNVAQITRRLYMEEIRKLRLSDEFLENIVQFLQSVERINKTRISVKALNLRRDDKNEDVWTADISISQRTAKPL